VERHQPLQPELPWCYNATGDGKDIAATTLVDWIAAGKNVLDRDASLILLGGEPMLRPRQLAACVTHARDFLTSEILVSTNGTVYDEAAACALRDSRTTVQVSIDHPKAAGHDAIRGRGVFDLATETARKFARKGIATVLSMVLTDGAESLIEDYFDLALELGVAEVRFIPMRQIGLGIAQSEKLPDLYGCFQTLVSLLDRRPELSEMLKRDFFSILMTVCSRSRQRDNCGIGRRVIFVDSDGDVYPCPNHRSDANRMGNIADKPLLTMWSDSSILADLRDSSVVDCLSQCRTCTFRHWCAGDCRAEARSVGSPDGPSPYCGQIQRIIKEMLWQLAAGQATLPTDQSDSAIC